MQEFLSTTQAAKILGITKTAVLKRIKSGSLKAQKIGHNYIIAKDDLPLDQGGVLTEERKEVIRKAVKKTIRDYGDTLKMLGRE